MVCINSYVANLCTRREAKREVKDHDSILIGRQKINWLTWASQMLVWCFITVLARSLVLITMLLFKDVALEDLSAWIAQSWSCSPADLLTLVMIACPVVMNIGMLIVSGAWLSLATGNPHIARGVPTRSVVLHVHTV